MDIAVLGPVELRGGAAGTVPVGGARLRTVLVLLALDAGRAVSADRLIDAVWGADRPAAAGNALQALVSRLRRAGLTIEATPTGYRLMLDPDRVDAHRFTRLAADDPAQALALWRGPLDFPEAAEPERVRLEQSRLAAQKAALDDRVRSGTDVTAELESLVAAHPLDETLAALLIRALRTTGNPGRALEVFATIRRRLADTLGADPSPELTALHLELLREGGPRGNLPAELSSFVGRDADVRAVDRLVRAHRLVTLLGPGGSGKTRLSVEAGPRFADLARHGVWQIELARVGDPAEVPQAILSALRLRSLVPMAGAAETAEPAARLREMLGGREIVLILDNCEHLVASVARLADDLLRAAPGLRLLATSREPLGLPGEQLYPVEPLPLPPAGAAPEVAAANPAIRLLADRAGARFVLDARTTGPAVRICRALDGMPLAIELAAARLRTLPVDVLADRLADRFRLLTGGSRAALPRHQTLRAVVDWSWDLLSEPERALWRRFAVFQGGARVTAAEQVCGADIDLLGALADKSLLVLSQGRYRMLETIREYGLERLAEAGESEQMRRSHAVYMLALADRQEPRLRRGDQLEALRVLGDDHENLHAAVRNAIRAGDSRTAFALVGRLGWYWWLSGHRAEGTTLTQEVLVVPGDADPEDRALAYAYAAINGLEGAAGLEEVKRFFLEADRLGRRPGFRHPVLRLIGPIDAIFDGGGRDVSFGLIAALFDDPDPWLRAVAKMMSAALRQNYGHPVEAAEAELRESLAGFREIGERWGVGFVLSSLGDIAAARGDFRQAVQWQREAVALVREVGIREDLPQLEVKLAHQLWMAGERDDAHRALKQARASAEEVGLVEVMASVEYGYAMVSRMEGDLSLARERIARSAEAVDRLAYAPQFRAVAKSSQGLIEAASGNLAAAAGFHADAIRIAVESTDSPVVAICLVGVADLALRSGDAVKAARLLGAADGVRGTIDRSVPDVDRITEEARHALGVAGFDAAYSDGRTVTFATAVQAAGLHAAAEGPDGERGEDREQADRPQQ